MEITGTLEHVIFASDSGFLVAKFNGASNTNYDHDGSVLKGSFTACGKGIPSSAEKLCYTLEGDWEKTEKYGWQFKFRIATNVVDQSETGIKTYLMKSIKGIGAKGADILYRTFGDKVLEVIDKEPEKLLSIPGIGKSKMITISESFKNMKASSELVKMLSPYGIDYTTIMRIYKKTGSNAVSYVKENPYYISESVQGISYYTVDKVGKAIGFAANDERRIRSALIQTLKDAETGGILFKREGGGHLCISDSEWIKKTSLILNEISDDGCIMGEYVTDGEIRCIAAQMVHEKKAYVYPNGMVERALVAKTEDRVAECIKRTLLGQRTFPKYEVVQAYIKQAEAECGIILAPEQRKAAETCLMSPLCIITGGPGTGKSTILNVILVAYNKMDKNGTVLLCAPTGKAARRMSETTNMPASTIHSALMLRGDESEQEIDYAQGKVPCDFLVTDEISMLDIYLARHLFEAIPDGSKLLLVGDTDQLPSIGPGAILRDLIECGAIPVVRLQKIYRQAGTSPIVINAKKISEGDVNLTYNQDFQFIETKSVDEAAKIIEDLYVKETQEVGTDEVVILSPFRVKTPTGANAMSMTIRDKLNPPRAPAYLNCYKKGEKEFRIGDKVMQTKNIGGISNGDTGYVVGFTRDDDGIMKVSVDYNGYVQEYGDNELDQIILAYALTVHKSQGCEYKTVIVTTQSIHNGMLERNLIYTAITRARKKVYIVGEHASMLKAIRTESAKYRSTLLRERIAAKIQAYKDDPKNSEKLQTELSI